MENLIQTKFLFSDAKTKQFFDSNPVQQTLRKEVEDLHIRLAKKQEEYDKIKNVVAKQSNEG